MIDMNVPEKLPSWAKDIEVDKIRTEAFSDHYSVVGDPIGRGRFAVVKKVVHKVTNEVFAAKFIRRRRKGQDFRNEILQEIAVLYLVLPHHRMVDVKEVFESRFEMVVVMEYAEGGELFQYCKGITETFTEEDVAHLIQQILEGLIFLHDRNVVHLDIKPENILLTKAYPEGRVKLCDFTCSQGVDGRQELKLICGTPDYVAPEVLQYEPITTATDMWSVGVVMYVMLTAHSPFGAGDKQETLLNVSQVNLTFPDDLFAKVSDAAIDFIKKCLLRDPRSRLTAREALEEEWMLRYFPAGVSAVPAIPSIPAVPTIPVEVKTPCTPPTATTLAAPPAPTTTQLPSPLGSPLPCRRAVLDKCDNPEVATPNKKYKCLEDGSNNNNLANGIKPITQEELVC